MKKKDLRPDYAYARNGQIIILSIGEYLAALSKPGLRSSFRPAPLLPGHLASFRFYPYRDCYVRIRKSTRFSSWLFHVHRGKLVSLHIDGEEHPVPRYIHSLQLYYEALTGCSLKLTDME